MSRRFYCLWAFKRDFLGVYTEGEPFALRSKLGDVAGF